MMRAFTTSVALCLLAIAYPVMGDGRTGGLTDATAQLTASPSGCPPLGGGLDSTPMTARLVIDDTGFGEPFVVRLSSAGQLPSQIQRSTQIGSTIPIEILQLELRGTHPRIGNAVLRISPSLTSSGQIDNVVLDAGCQLAAGDARLDAFFELEVEDANESWVHPSAVRLESSLAGPLTGTMAWEVSRSVSQPLEEMGSLAPRGDLFYVELLGAPPFPAADAICSEVLFTADVQISGEPDPAELIGFGSSRLEFGAVDQGGTCNLAGTPCTSDNDCNFLDTCRRTNVATELTELPFGGFDLQLGSWALDVRPVLGVSDCCEAHPSAGCSDSSCEALVCSLDSFCCTSGWDELCATLASGEPLCEETCFDPLATPSLGSVTSNLLTETYPATHSNQVYVTLETQAFGELHNALPIVIQPTQSVTNLPTDPMTELLQGGSSVPLLSPDGTPLGQISNLVKNVQTTTDCAPPPGAELLCRQLELELQGDFPGCPAEPLTLVGLQRLYRDNPRSGVGFGQQIIDTLAVESQWDGSGSCLGPLTVRLAPQLPAALGAVASLTPEEFFPALATMDLHLEFEAGPQLWSAGPLHVETTTNLLASPDGERFTGLSLPIDLLDAASSPVGQLTLAVLRYGAEVPCPADAGAYITFSDPDDLDLRGLGGGQGAKYQILKGDLGSLVAGAGSLATANCIDGLSADFNDPATPAGGQAFYYLARDGFGLLFEDWESGGPAQVGNRDASAPSCP